LPLPPPEIFKDSTGIKQAPMADTLSSTPLNATLVPPIQPSRSLRSSLCKILKMHANKFGLFRVYYTDSVPHHDPEDPYLVENTHLPRECSDSVPSEPSNLLSTNPYYPYPNQGAQKSWDSFKELLNIVGDPAFSLSAISQTQWGIINKELGRNHFDGDLPQWLHKDDGWKCSPVTISVPFHSRAKNLGCKDYTVQGFYHWSLVSIV